ncbi:ISH9-type transposase [Natrinema limicola JCM 13563]|uniref:ISH9-type transposase n=1 Tax=Natrinema limicola JCM 13563 TaxID=1230457 RepID=M0CUP8_9EURY|nr:ISH9-type transposase [Natrinema limicola JCM 13563]
MEIDLLDFVEQCRDLAKQALGKHAGEPASGGSARWVHVVIHCSGSKKATATVKRRIG